MDEQRMKMMEAIGNRSELGGYPRWFVKSVARMAIEERKSERINMPLEEFCIRYANKVSEISMVIMDEEGK